MTIFTTKLLTIFVVVSIVLLSACSTPANNLVHTQALGAYLKDLFESHDITLDSSDFLGPVEEPYLAFAKMLNLIPSSEQGDKEITDEIAEQISEQFLSIKDYILLDGLYGKIDMHEHYRDDGDVEEFLSAAGCLGISKVLFVPTGLGPDNEGYEQHQESLIKHIKEEFPEKIIAFCTIDEADPRAAEIFEQCLKDGADGLKLIGGHTSFYDEPLNSENMYKVYQKASEYGVPILLHGSILTIRGLKEQLEKVYSDFPEVTFIHAHYSSTIMNGIHLDECAELLDKYPNLYIDLSMGGGIKRYHGYYKLKISIFVDFLVAYQNRILFGSDIILNTAKHKDFDWLYRRMKCDIDLHQQEYYDCSFGEEENPKPGFYLDEEVLRKLYYENPRKVLGY
ncbi:MAG: amidohydrolase family protein [Dehalococcoidales bacterium]|nr:MAG: amidohydrolase family protein [Dehalococcoidales bacterium]